MAALLEVFSVTGRDCVSVGEGPLYLEKVQIPDTSNYLLPIKMFISSVASPQVGARESSLLQPAWL